MKLARLFSIVLSLVVIQACSNVKSNNNEPKDDGMKLYVLDCGTINVKDISLFSPGIDKGKKKKLANSCYLIKHPQGNFLWDTGLNDSLVKESDGLTIANGMFHLQVHRTLVSQLHEIGLTPADIDYVALSHFHFDHTGNMNLFSKATFLAQQHELAAAFSNKAREMYFEPDSYNLIKKEQFVSLSGDYDVFKDGKLVILSSPGHTPGHQSLQINLAAFGAVVLSGDLYHFDKNRKHKRVPAVNFDKAMSLMSMDVIENVLKDINGELWIQHDLPTYKQLKHSPEFYY